MSIQPGDTNSPLGVDLADAVVCHAANFDEAPVFDGHIRAYPRIARAVENFAIADDDVIHGTRLRKRGGSRQQAFIDGIKHHLRAILMNVVGCAWHPPIAAPCR